MRPRHVIPRARRVSGGFNAFWAPKSHALPSFTCRLLDSSVGPAPGWIVIHPWLRFQPSCHPPLPAGSNLVTTLDAPLGCLWLGGPPAASWCVCVNLVSSLHPLRRIRFLPRPAFLPSRHLLLRTGVPVDNGDFSISSPDGEVRWACMEKPGLRWAAAGWVPLPLGASRRLFVPNHER